MPLYLELELFCKTFSFQVNTNIGNSGNMQMAGGMAMSGRLFDLEHINSLRTRFWRKLEEQNLVASEPTTLPTPPPSMTTTPTPTPVTKQPHELQMALLMEKLYHAEVEHKPQGPQDEMRQKVRAFK